MRSFDFTQDRERNHFCCPRFEDREEPALSKVEGTGAPHCIGDTPKSKGLGHPYNQAEQCPDCSCNGHLNGKVGSGSKPRKNHGHKPQSEGPAEHEQPLTWATLGEDTPKPRIQSQQTKL
jgi:hypothetical protein